MLVYAQIALVIAQLFLLFVLVKQIRQLKDKTIEQVQDDVEVLQEELEFADKKIKELDDDYKKERGKLEDIINRFAKQN